MALGGRTSLTIVPMTPAASMASNSSMLEPLGSSDRESMEPNTNCSNTIPDMPMALTRSNKGRGPTKGKGLDKMNKVVGKMPIQISKVKGRPLNPVQSSKLSSEHGIVALNMIPIPQKWKYLDHKDKKAGMEWLKRDKNTGAEPDEIEVYRRIHYKEGKGWYGAEAGSNYNKMIAKKNQPTPEGESSLSPKDIVNEVLGQGSSYLTSVGYAQKDGKSRSSQSRTLQLEKELQNSYNAQNDLQNRLQVAEEAAKTQQTKIESILSRQDQYERIIQALIASGAHHPIDPPNLQDHSNDNILD